MAQSTSAAFKAAVAADQADHVGSVSVDWARDGHGAAGTADRLTEVVSGWSVTRSLASDLPPEVTLLSGSTAARADFGVTVSPTNADQSAALWMRAYTAGLADRVPGERVAAPTTIDAGFVVPGGSELVRLFTGRTRMVETNHDTTARVEALDLAERLRKRVDLPFVVADDLSSSTAAAKRPGLSGRWVVDYALRRCGLYEGLPPRGNVDAVTGLVVGEVEQVSATMAGSAAPETGSLNRAYRFLPATGLATVNMVETKEGPTEAAPVRGYLDFSGTTGSQSLVDYAPVEVVPIGSRFMVECELHVMPRISSGVRLWSFNNNGNDQVNCYVLGGTNTIQVDIEQIPGTFVTVVGPTVPEWVVNTDPATDTTPLRYLGVEVAQGATSATVIFRINGVTTTRTAVMTSNRTAQPGRRSLGIDSSFLRIRNLILSTGGDFGATGISTWHDTFVPTATLRGSLNQLSATPVTDRVSALDLIKQVTAAEFGSFEFTEAGHFRWFNRNRFQEVPSSKTVQATYTSDTIFTAGTTETIDSVRNVVRIPITSAVLQEPRFVWSLADVINVPPLTTITLFARFDTPVINLSTTVRAQPIGGVGQSAYRRNTQRDGTGTTINNLIFTVTPLGQGAKITIRNPDASLQAWLVNDNSDAANAPRGAPSLALWGTPVGFGAQTGAKVLGVTTTTSSLRQYSEAVDATSVTLYDEQELTLDDSQWRQQSGSMDALAASLVGQLARPTPTVESIDVIPDPARQIGDRVVVKETVTGIDWSFFVVGITTAMTEGGLTQRLDLRSTDIRNQL